MSAKMTLSIASDHGGFTLKDTLISYLTTQHPSIEVIDQGTHSTESVDYPDYAKKVCQAIESGQSNLGILVCGSGIGMSICANRFSHIRAALVYDTTTAQLTKAHNNANVICLGERTTPQKTAIQIVETWLNTDFEGGRHQKRIQKL